MQDLREAARGLGVSPQYADALATRFWEDVYPQNDPEYRTPDCRDGGPFDRRPDDPRWP